MCAVLNAFPNLFLYSRLHGANNPTGVQSMIAIKWPLLILTDSPEFPRKLPIAEMVEMCGNKGKVTNKRFDGNWRNMYIWDLHNSCYPNTIFSILI